MRPQVLAKSGKVVMGALWWAGLLGLSAGGFYLGLALATWVAESLRRREKSAEHRGWMRGHAEGSGHREQMELIRRRQRRGKDGR